MIEAAELARLLEQGAFDLSHEAATQADVELFLAAHLPLGCTLEREVRLDDCDRPDFVVDGRIVVEVKVKGAQRRAIERQLARYAEHRSVEALVLLTNVAMPPRWELNSKPVFVASLGRGWL